MERERAAHVDAQIGALPSEIVVPRQVILGEAVAQNASIVFRDLADGNRLALLVEHDPLAVGIDVDRLEAVEVADRPADIDPVRGELDRLARVPRGEPILRPVHVVRQAQQPVGVGGPVRAARPANVRVAHHVVGQLDLDALVPHVPDVGQDGPEQIRRHGDGIVVQHVFGVALIDIHAAGEAELKQREVQADIDLLLALPPEVRVGIAGGRQSLHPPTFVGELGPVAVARE